MESRDAYKLKLTMKSGQVRHLWVDAESFADVKVEGTPRGSLLSRLPERERPHGSLCSFLETTVQRVKKSHKMIVESVVVKPKIDDSLLTQLKP